MLGEFEYCPCGCGLTRGALNALGFDLRADERGVLPNHSQADIEARRGGERPLASDFDLSDVKTDPGIYPIDLPAAVSGAKPQGVYYLDEEDYKSWTQDEIVWPPTFEGEN